MAATFVIDFARPQPKLALRRSWPGLTLLGLGIVVAAGLIVYQVMLEQRMNRLSAEREAQRRTTVQDGRTVRWVASAVAEEAHAANRAIERLSVPWAEMFRSLEEARSENILLLSLQPHPGRAEVRVSGEANGFPAITKFLAALDSQPSLSGAHLVGHEARSGSTVRFEVLVRWPQPR